jgi:hypothetical protein
VVDIIVGYKRIRRGGNECNATNNGINLSNECVLSCKWLKK